MTRKPQPPACSQRRAICPLLEWPRSVRHEACRVSPLGWWGFGAGAGRDGLCPVCLEGFGVGHRVVVSELPTK
ncbi:hypothetical protein ACN94_21710 [Gordonia paraffinivorans]|nr:hypothetical protein [Gordonia paraffinivorans]MBY4576147.1 hypothetical protein [Gordonia paraffinivorans]